MERLGTKMSKKYAEADPKVCVACGVCAKVCPMKAITIPYGCYAFVNTKKCVGCGKCAGSCPAGCMEIKERDQG